MAIFEKHKAVKNSALPTFSQYTKTYEQNRSYSPINHTAVTSSDFSHFLAVLHELSQKQRWVFFTSNVPVPSKAVLLSAGIDINKIVVMKASRTMTEEQIISKAISCGTASAIIGLKPSTTSQYQALNKQAERNNVRAFFFPPNTPTLLH